MYFLDLRVKGLNSLLVQVHNAEGMATLFRGNSLTSKTMKIAFRVHGSSYLNAVLEPLVSSLYEESLSYEVDPTR